MSAILRSLLLQDLISSGIKSHEVKVQPTQIGLSLLSVGQQALTPMTKLGLAPL